MRDLFPGFYYSYPQGEELSKLWGEAVFVFDANMLLNIYRYSSSALDRYFEILGRLQKQVWLPYQAASEYQENREIVIKARAKAYDSALAVLERSSREFSKLLGPDYNKHFMSPEELTKSLLEEIENSKKKLSSHAKKSKKNIYRLLDRDTLRDKLESLFHGSIGKPYRWDDLQKMYERAELRFKLGIPPGLRDQETKENYRKYGDVILWFQLIDYARSQKRPLIFVTDDGKDDWWKFDGDKQIGPRSELIQEIFIEADTVFYMYKGYDFIETAAKVFGLEDKPEVVEEAKEISHQNELDAKEKNILVYQGEVLSDYSYERNPILRKETIKIHGMICKVCGFDFYACYGERGKGYIEVHHLRPVHSLGGDKVDPRTDMTVLCSNCHRMIHREQDRVLSIEELKSVLRGI